MLRVLNLKQMRGQAVVRVRAFFFSHESYAGQIERPDIFRYLGVQLPLEPHDAGFVISLAFEIDGVGEAFLQQVEVQRAGFVHGMGSV